MSFNENTRVKIPAILHLCRLGYDYLTLSGMPRDENTNIFTGLFSVSIGRINPDLEESSLKRLLEDISLALDNEDLGEAFYRMLTARSGVKLIDFIDFSNNSFHLVTELPCNNGDDEFRPDITLLVNGMPLAFIEVKKPNNHEGILEERDRMNARFRNKKFKKFINISQLLVFSNNMEYDQESTEPVQGAFYSSTSYGDVSFNCFREEEELDLSLLLSTEDDNKENFVLKDNNLAAIKYSPEFITNKEPATPTNRLLTSLFCRERLAMLLQFGFAYAQETKGVEKQIMRYPQLFATKAIQQKIASGTKKGIIWHTQGSGKTVLAYYNIHFLTDYFQQQEIIPKFYFISGRPQGDAPTLGDIIGAFKSLCVNAWLRVIKTENVNARGKFWLNNYYEHVIRNEDEMNRIRQYVVDNPAKWELDRENPLSCGQQQVEKWMI